MLSPWMAPVFLTAAEDAGVPPVVRALHADLCGGLHLPGTSPRCVRAWRITQQARNTPAYERH